jgi:hypothetical protein
MPNRTLRKSTGVRSDTRGGPQVRLPRDIPIAIKCQLWGRAAGRCEFRDCNRPLWKSSITHEPVNLAELGHIYSFSENGPRGNQEIQQSRLNTIDNLILVCPACHKLIDDEPDGGRYTAALLQEWKADHERRVEIATSIAPGRRSHVLVYSTNIDAHGVPVRFHEAAQALFPDYFPAAECESINLRTLDAVMTDRDEAFWSAEAQNLTTRFDQRVRQRLDQERIEHISVFALAPQPLLILLGSLLCDIARADVYQLHREPQGWSWPTDVATPDFDVREPERTGRLPALVLSLSATVTHDRITQVLGPDAVIWTVTIPTPHNDFTKTRAQLAEFRTIMRELLDRIKARYGQTTPLHVFPAMSVSTAVELGRVRAPKANSPWIIYDQVNARGGFVPVISIPPRP